MNGTPPRRLLRSQNRRVGGVAAGVAEYLSLDPTLVRVAFAVAVLIGWGFPIVLYVLLWVIMPEAPADAAVAVTTTTGRSAATIIGVLVALVLVWLWTANWMWGMGGGWMGGHMGRFGFGMMPFGGPLVALTIVVLIVLLLRDGRPR